MYRKWRTLLEKAEDFVSSIKFGKTDGRDICYSRIYKIQGLKKQYKNFTN